MTLSSQASLLTSVLPRTTYCCGSLLEDLGVIWVSFGTPEYVYDGRAEAASVWVRGEYGALFAQAVGWKGWQWEFKITLQ